jgi:pimeloyl-ACP methyl ester carboxylesterase
VAQRSEPWVRPGTPRLSYIEARGETAGVEVPVLLIHGNFSGKGWWRELSEDPPAGTRLLVPDLPGFGDSTAGYHFLPSMKLYADALHGFLDSLNIDEAVLVGHSMGGAIAMQLALSEPERFPGMMLLSPAPPEGLDTPDYVYPILKTLRHDRRALRRALKRMMRSRVPYYLEDLVDNAARMHPEGFAGNARMLSEWRLNGELSGYHNPVLVVSGDRDTLVPPSSAESTSRHFPDSHHILLSGITHSPQIEAPEKVKHLFKSFMDGL